MKVSHLSASGRWVPLLVCRTAPPASTTIRTRSPTTFSKIVGKHSLKFGGDIRYIQVNERNTYTSNGWFEFDGGETGNDFADYLLGAPDLFNQTSPQLLDSRTKYFGLYAQDTYRVSSDLTINYGVRWDVSQPFYDTKDRIQTFVPGVQSTVYPDSPTGFVFPKDPGMCPAL